MALARGLGAVDLEMEEEFAGAETIAGDDVAFHIGEADVGRRHVALADHGGGAKNVAGSDAAAYVTAVAVDILAIPEFASGADDFVTQRPSFEGVEDRGWGAFFRFGDSECIDHSFEHFLDLVCYGIGDLGHENPRRGTQLERASAGAAGPSPLHIGPNVPAMR
jgi:hypothetical protein